MSNELTLLKGKITSYHASLLKADFFSGIPKHNVPSEESVSAALVAGAAAMGLGAAAMATALNNSSRYEEAERVSFQLNGERIEGPD